MVNGPFTGTKERRSFKPKVASSILVGRMGRSAGRCRPFPFVEPDRRLRAGEGFRVGPGDSAAFRGIVATSWSHSRLAIAALPGFDLAVAATARRLPHSRMSPTRRRPAPRCAAFKPRSSGPRSSGTKQVPLAAKVSSVPVEPVSRRERSPPRRVFTTAASRNSQRRIERLSGFPDIHMQSGRVMGPSGPSWGRAIWRVISVQSQSCP